MSISVIEMASIEATPNDLCHWQTEAVAATHTTTSEQRKGIFGRVGSHYPYARWPQIRGWFAVSLMIALMMLFGVAAISHLLPADFSVGARSGLFDDHPDLEDLWVVFQRNLLVLALHVCACWVGAIVGRPHPVSKPGSWWAKLNPPVPPWLGRASLLYALCVTLFSVALQTTALGFVLSDVAAAAEVDPFALWLLVLPHALIELTAVFLPLGLFLIQAKRGELAPLGVWSAQAALIALPMLIVAAFIETYISPELINFFL